MLCPKCGSDQVMNDQCLKCGIVISKYRAPQPGSAAPPVSFVAAPHQAEPSAGYSIPAAVVERQEALKRSKQKRMLVTACVVVAILIVCNLTYRFFVHRAAHYSGVYKNGNMLFALKFPENESRWYHYPKGEPDSPLYRDVMDAFHRGDDPDEPEVVIGVWREVITPVPDRMNESLAAQLLGENEDALLQIMSSRGVDCTITDSRKVISGDNDGFRMDADIKVDGKPMKLVAVRAFNVSGGYWFFVSGTEQMMNQHHDEVAGLIDSVSFRMSIF